MKLPRHPCIILCIASTVFCITPVTSAEASVVIDQEVVVYSDQGFIPYILDYPGDYMAQTFTVRNSGQLVAIGLQVSISPYSPSLPPIDDLHVKVTRTDSAGAPLIDAVLAEATIGRFSLERIFQPGPMTNVDLAGWQLQVTAGDRLAIALSSNQTYYVQPHKGADYMWQRSTKNELPGGEYFIYSPLIFGPATFKDIYRVGNDRTIDAGYRVFIDSVPEPTTISFAWALLIWLQHSRVRRRTLRATGSASAS